MKYTKIWSDSQKEVTLLSSVKTEHSCDFSFPPGGATKIVLGVYNTSSIKMK